MFPLATPLDESPQDDAAAKANAPLTRETDLVVLYSDLENIFDEEEDELGVSEGGRKRSGTESEREGGREMEREREAAMVVFRYETENL